MEPFTSIAEWLNTNPLANVVFLILAILGLLLSYYLYRKSQRIKIPSYLSKSINLIEDSHNKIDRLKILFDNNEISNLTLTKVSIWNHGNEIIDSSDIAAMDPLRIESKKEKILDAEIFFESNPVNNFSIEVSSENVIIIHFDYFGNMEGVKINIYHTGKSSDDITVSGTVKGVKSIRNLNNEKEKYTDWLGTNTVWKIPRKTRLHPLVFPFILTVFMPVFVPFFIADSVRSAFRIASAPRIFEIEE